jgi:hypothetical protein
VVLSKSCSCEVVQQWSLPVAFGPAQEGSGKLVRRVSRGSVDRTPDPCRESRREQAIA